MMTSARPAPPDTGAQRSRRPRRAERSRSDDAYRDWRRGTASPSCARGCRPSPDGRRCAEGLACWGRDGTARRLRLTDAGRAHLRRHAPADGDGRLSARNMAIYARRPLEKGARPTLVNEAKARSPGWRGARTRDGRPFLDARAGRSGRALPSRHRTGANPSARHRQLGGVDLRRAPRGRRRRRGLGSRDGRAQAPHARLRGRRTGSRRACSPMSAAISRVWRPSKASAAGRRVRARSC